MTQIDVTVSPAGDVQLRTRGFAGRECLAASRFLETALGRPTSDRLTGEFYLAARAPCAQVLATRQPP